MLCQRDCRDVCQQDYEVCANKAAIMDFDYYSFIV